ncbi:MAG: EamA family transporter [Nitrososphaeria archaeon]
MIDIALSILASFFLASSVVDIRRGLQKMDYITCSIIITLVGLIILVPATILLTDLKHITYDSVILFTVGGVLAPGLARLFLFKSIEKMGALITASIMPAQPIISATLATLMLSEKPSIGLWAGIFSIVLGATFIETSRTREGGSTGFTPWLLLPLSGIVFGGLSDLTRKVALSTSPLPLLGTTIANVSSLLPFAITFILSSDPKKARVFTGKNVLTVWKGGLFMTAGWLLSFYALSYGEVSRVIPLVSTQPLFVFLIARIYLKGVENMSWKPVAGATVIISGIILLLVT